MQRQQVFRSLITVLIFGLLPLTAADAQNPVPFKLTGTATWDNLMNAFPPGDGTPAVGAHFEDGAGRARHLGRFTAVGSLFATGAPDSNGDFPVIGFVTLVAANGDQLESMFFGDLNVSGVGTAQYQFMGGSGRFEDATGEGTIDAFLDTQGGMNLENVPMVVTWDGVIDY